MAQTPKKLVHWNLESPSSSILNSPFFNATHESSMDSDSSLEYINSQLTAHGFVSPPGLSLSGISNDDSARVVKCLLGMLGQRVEDMSRTEELTTRLRTLSYDHERLQSMHRTALEKCANAERETNLHKSRLAATLKTLQASENSHRQTTAELQRTRTLIQGLRATHIAELKKKEKEVERTMDKWQKLADSQVKLGTAHGGMRCVNAVAVEGTQILGRGQGFLEIALEQAEQARSHLGDENLGLRKMLLRTTNEMQNILQQAQCLMSGEQSSEASAPLTLSTLFPLSPPDLANDKCNALLSGLRDAISKLSRPVPAFPSTSPTPQIPSAEIERLQTVILSLKEELARSQKQSMAQLTETQAMFDKFADDHRIATGEIGEMSVELLTAPLRDEEQERLDKLRKELDTERQKFTDAAIRFGKEKAALEAERIKFLDEKRSWQVEMMLADLPPTPAPVSPVRNSNALTTSPKKSPHKSSHKTLHPRSPRRSPAKNVCVGKAGSGRKAHRVSRRSLTSPVKMVLSYETEVIPPITAPSFPPLKLLAPSGSLLPTSFVLPPPSPRASLPTGPALPPASTTPESLEESTTPITSSDMSPPSPENDLLQVPETPSAVKRGFPVAKPFAQRMIHAYSPAKPSPLSRILMLADSPLTPPQLPGQNDSLSPTYGSLEPVAEEEDDGLEYIANALSRIQNPQRGPQMSLAAELGVESPPESPLQEKKFEPNVAPPVVQPVFRRGRVFHPEPSVKKPCSTAEKGKARATESAPRSRSSGLGEKENSIAKEKGFIGKSGKISPLPSSANSVGPLRVGNNTKPVTKPSVKATTAAVGNTGRAKAPTKPTIPPIAGNGPRRVLINSVDAPPIGKGWKG